MLKVGVTGGIGTGKSTVCMIFETLGIKIFVADNEAKKLLETPEVEEFYSKEFGNVVYSEGKLDRTKIAKLLFSDQELLQKVNNFIHPLVNKQFDDWCQRYQNEPYVIKETALLFETGAYKHINFKILIISPIEIRIERTLKRDNTTKEQILERISHQWDDGKKIPLANAIIVNDNVQLLLPQVLELDKNLKSLAKQKK